MKRISLILILLMLALFQIPQTHAAYLDESPDSITSFSETLPDDVLYFPDSFDAGIIELADYGEISDESYSADYILTHALDGSAFNETTATDIEIWFEVDTTVAGFEGFSYAHYLDVDSGTDVDLTAYDFDQDLFVKIDEPLPSSYAWMNGTISNPDYWNTTPIAFSMYELSGTADLYWDYGEITIHRMTLTDSGYAESFADVSDWSSYNGVENFGSDGDVGYFETLSESENDYEGIEITGLSISTEGYFEIRFMANDTVADYVQFRLVDSGSKFYYVSPAEPTTWTTRRDYIKGMTNSGGAFDTITKIQLMTRLDDGLSIKISFDYLRISPANESGGYQHDGSTTEGISYGSSGESGITYSVSSDGDKITLNATRSTDEVNYADFYISFDNMTTTALDIERDYYPFWKINVTSISTVGCTVSWRIESDGYRTSYVPLQVGNNYYNHKTSVDVDPDDFVYIFGTLTDIGDTMEVVFDFVKAYSIANFTVADLDDEAVTNVVYVDSGRLVVSEAGDYIRFTHDITTAISSAIYTVWNATLSGDVSGFRFHELSYTNEYHDIGETRGVIVSTMLVAWEFLAYTGLEISAIKFIDTRDWQEIGEVDFVMPVGWDPTFIFGYDAFFIFLGLIMIPVSTMYLVRGGREEMSADKLFYGLIIFAVGFGLLVGGIMP